jgi:arylsulfatase A-like enzyme
MDEQVGRLRTTLRELGIADNTMLWFCSDNGPEGTAGVAPGTAGPFRGRKRDLFEGGVRVPGLLEWPAKVEPGSVTDFPAVTSDYVPTMLDVLDIEMPDDRPIDCVSLLPMLEGKTSTRAKPIGFALGGRVALTDNRYKIVRYDKTVREVKADRADAMGTGEYMLFDLLADPGEENDLAQRHPEIVEQMTATLDAWLESCAESDAWGQDADTDDR